MWQALRPLLAGPGGPPGIAENHSSSKGMSHLVLYRETSGFDSRKVFISFPKSLHCPKRGLGPGGVWGRHYVNVWGGKASLAPISPRGN